MERGSEVQDKAGEEYWSATYAANPSKDVFDPHTGRVRHYWKRQLHEYFSRTFLEAGANTGSLLEIGCGGSRMLGYFAREFSFEVSGLDYSAAGCRSADENLREEGLPGSIVCADLFKPRESLRGRFDVVVSFGVVEHFTETAECISAISRFLRPNGLLITSVPNMSGVVGRLQGWLDRKVLDKHVAMSREELRHAHEEAGLSVLSCEYLLFVNLAVANLNETPRATREHSVKTIVMNGMRAITGCIWAFESVVRPLTPNRATSPYIICAARKHPDGIREENGAPCRAVPESVDSTGRERDTAVPNEQVREPD